MRRTSNGSYKEIQISIKEKHGIIAQICLISHMKEKFS